MSVSANRLSKVSSVYRPVFRCNDESAGFWCFRPARDLATVARRTSSALTNFRGFSKSSGTAMVPPGNFGFSVTKSEKPLRRTVRTAMTSPLVANALTVRSSTCVPRFLGSYRTTTLTLCPGKIFPLAGVGLKKVVRSMT